MAWGEYRAQIRERDYQVGGGRDIRAAEINPRARYSSNDYEEWLYKTRRQQVGLCAFHAVNQHGSITMPNIARYQIREATARNIEHPKGKSRYVVALQGTDALLASSDAPNTDAVAAYARVETWRRGRGLGRMLGKQFPVLTELYTPDGYTRRQYHQAVAAVVHYSLTQADMEAPVGLRIAEADREGVAYFETIGFEARSVSEAANGYGMSVDMMTDPYRDRFDIQQALEAQYPFLASEAGTII